MIPSSILSFCFTNIGQRKATGLARDGEPLAVKEAIEPACQ